MRLLALVLSLVALALTIVPAFFYFYGQAALDGTKLWMLIGTGLWFATAPLWMDRDGARP